MKNIKVTILHCTPESVAINAVAKPYKNEKSSLSLVKKVGFVYKHESVLEHITVNFDISGISRLCLQELCRHRIASYTVESTRFTLQKINPADPIEKYFVIPEFSDASVQPEYEAYCKSRLTQLSDYVLSKRIRNDEIKYFLPENFRTNLTMSINLRSLINFISLRYSKEAHFEIRHLASLIIEELRKTYIKEIVDLDTFTL